MCLCKVLERFERFEGLVPCEMRAHLSIDQQEADMRIFLSILAIGFWASQVAAQDVPQIVVSGTGEIAVEPDLAVVTLGVGHEANTAQEAMNKVSSDMTALMATLEAEGIAKTDIQTRRVQIQPIYQQDRRLRFRASNQVTVRVRELTRIGAILGQGISDGANEIGGWSSGLRFDVSDPAPFESEARQAAVRNAMTKAQELAAAAGVSLGAIQEIREGGGGGNRPMPMARAEMSMAQDVPVAAGEMIIRAQVQMVFAIAE